MLVVNKLSGGYEEKQVVHNVSFQVAKGEILGILGPNGSGKSTLLKMISGLLPITNGTVLIDGRSSEEYSQKEFARTMAVLPQLHVHAFSHTVRETVSLGRYPYQSGFFSTWSDQDEQAVQDAMTSTAIQQYEHQSIEYLSGGERQRVFVAQALAQQTPLLLLDEPTNHLDIAHQQQLLDVITKQAKAHELTVISVFHDINLASLYCDRLLLLDEGTVSVIGTPQQVIDTSVIEEVYEARVRVGPHPELPKPQLTLLPTTIHANNDKVTIEQFEIHSERVVLTCEQSLKVVSSAVHNPGMGWYRHFVNRHVSKDYYVNNVHEELQDYLTGKHFPLAHTVAMMTAVHASDVVIKQYAGSYGSVIIAVTAGVGNAVDVSQTIDRHTENDIGTINTWVIINGNLSDEAFIQAMITATEAKVKALQVKQVKDPFTNTIATGTSTDSLLIAATQKGEVLQYAGPITALGKQIAQGVFECTMQAIQNSEETKGVQ